MLVRTPYIVIAAFNEGAVIRSVITELTRRGWPVVVVDDGSIDNTSNEARIPGVHVVRHPTNLGQGASLQTGIEFALRRGADAIVTFDADGQHNPDDIPRLLAALSDHDIVLGSRFLGMPPVDVSFGRRLLLRAAAYVSNTLSGLPLTDAHCGLRAFRTSAAPALVITQNRMAHASELLRKIKRNGLRVGEIPVTVSYTAYSKEKGQTAIQAIRVLFDYYAKGTRAQ